jgi:hypothetical protein
MNEIKKKANPAELVELPTIDLKEFARQKLIIQKQASIDCAAKIQSIKLLLTEIKELVTLSGITIDLRELKYDFEAVEELHPEWNSSSYDC